jgi:hypothetical protein
VREARRTGKASAYRTTHAFLRCFNISSLNELPELSDKEADTLKANSLIIQSAIENLKLMEERGGKKPEEMRNDMDNHNRFLLIIIACFLILRIA